MIPGRYRRKILWLGGIFSLLFITLYSTLTRSIHFQQILIGCDVVPLNLKRHHHAQRGQFLVYYNYFIPQRQFNCSQTITYTTHGEWNFLDNLVPLLERWQGPISIALYTLGTDFDETINRIQFLRECDEKSSLVKQLVTFHIFFHQSHTPNVSMASERDPPVNCTELSAKNLTFGDRLETYRKLHHLAYPVNVARNVAREMATTHFVFASDIELYPSPGLIPQFLEMIQRNDAILQTRNPKVFVLPIFEVDSKVAALPRDKSELIEMLRNKSAIPFHQYVCSNCHRIPKFDEWVRATPNETIGILHVSHVGKRAQKFKHWEPIFIGTKSDPVYDERLSWEGLKDKQTQGYALCVLDYEFHILDTAFLVHKPGIKRAGNLKKYKSKVAKQNSLIKKQILPELRKKYGSRPGCVA